MAVTVAGPLPGRMSAVVVWYFTLASAAALTPVRVCSLIWLPVREFGLMRLGGTVFGLIRLPGSELGLICFPSSFPAA